MAFIAKFPSECAECQGQIEIGDLVTYDGDDVIHAAEVNPFSDRDRSEARGSYHGRTETVCPVCFLTVCDGHE